jgi:hypothetical protein
MNFKNMPGLNTAYGYFVVLGLMACLPFPVRCASRRPSGYEYRMSRFSSSSPLVTARLVREFVHSTRGEGASMTSHVTDVLEAVQSFIAKGYDREYRVKDGNLVDLELGSILDSRTIRVDAALRLESGDDVEDASNIYAITDPATRA